MADLFEEKAKDWDANERRSSLARAIGNTILERVDLNEQMTVMDFGAGTGLVSSAIAPGVKRILAVDTSQAMLEKLAAKPELQGKVDIFCRDITESPLQNSVDLIVSAMTLHHVKDIPVLFQIFAQHLNRGGIVALADLDKEDGSFHPEGTEGVFHCGFDREELRRMMQNNGFEKVEFVTAHTINGDRGDFPVFLVTARKAI
jgi:predicted TPR repeat methyltransferase